jgi:hypothetical protein
VSELASEPMSTAPYSARSAEALIGGPFFGEAPDREMRVHR